MTAALPGGPILLLGKDGQLGWELQRALTPLGHLVAHGRESADLSRPETLAELVANVRPVVVVNAAAYTAVDRAEQESDLAYAVNGVAPGVLADACARIGAWLVHYSTDYVFSGESTVPYREEDAVGPINAYGRSKLAGELAIRERCKTHLIFRTSWVYAARGGNFARTMLRLAQERDSISVVSDQHGAPTGAELIADVTAHALRAAMGEPSLAGLYHLAASGETTWYGYARFVLGEAERLGIPLRAGPESVRGIRSAEYRTAARRPLSSLLDTTLLRRRFRLALPEWQWGVRRFADEIGR